MVYGFGWGHGWRNWYRATGLPGWARFGYAPDWCPPCCLLYAPQPTKEQEAGVLKQQADWLKKQLDAISQRIAELEQQK